MPLPEFQSLDFNLSKPAFTKTDDKNETETQIQQEEEKKGSNEEKVENNLKREEPREKQ